MDIWKTKAVLSLFKNSMRDFMNCNLRTTALAIFRKEAATGNYEGKKITRSRDMKELIMKENTKKEYLGNLDILKIVATICIVFHHYQQLTVVKFGGY